MSKKDETMNDALADLDQLIEEAKRGEMSIDRVNAAMRGYGIKKGFLSNQLKVARETNCCSQLKAFYGLK